MRKKIIATGLVLMFTVGGTQVYAATVLNSSIVQLVKDGIALIIGASIATVAIDTKSETKENATELKEYVEEKTGKAVEELNKHIEKESSRAKQELDAYTEQLKSEVEQLVTTEVGNSKEKITTEVNVEIENAKSSLQLQIETTIKTKLKVQ